MWHGSPSSVKLVIVGPCWSRRKLEDTVTTATVTTVTAATPVSPGTASPATSTPDGVIDRQAEGIGARIRERRLARGLTLVQLAGIAELSHPFLSRIERGRARPSMVSLERIARAIGSSRIERIADAEADEDSPAPTREPAAATPTARADFWCTADAGFIRWSSPGRTGSPATRSTSREESVTAGEPVEPGGYRLFVVKERLEQR